MCLVSQARPGLTHLLNSIAVTTQLAHAAETLLPPRRTREREEERERERERKRERRGSHSITVTYYIRTACFLEEVGDLTWFWE